MLIKSTTTSISFSLLTLHVTALTLFHDLWISLDGFLLVGARAASSVVISAILAALVLLYLWLLLLLLL